jgi:hypothetical protein
MNALKALLLLSALGLSAQDNGNRFGLSLAYLGPVGTWSSTFGSGFQGGLQIHFNRESPFLGRLRIDYLRSDSRHPVFDGMAQVWNGTAYVPIPTTSDRRMEAYTVMYEVMPHLEGHSRSGLFGILGLGGTVWNETIRARGPVGLNSTSSDLGMTLSAGGGWRFNVHATIEARYVYTSLPTWSFFGSEHQPHYGNDRAWFNVGTSIRF